MLNQSDVGVPGRLLLHSGEWLVLVSPLSLAISVRVKPDRFTVAPKMFFQKLSRLER